jgi:hypothetical protein
MASEELIPIVKIASEAKDANWVGGLKGLPAHCPSEFW